MLETKAPETTSTETGADVQTPEQIAAAQTAGAVKTDVSAQAKEVSPAKSLMDEAVSKETEAEAAESKRLLETPKDKLSAEDQVKRDELIKANEEKAKAEKDNVVPEKYDFKVPEGLKVDPEYTEKASAIMKKHNITQAAATELGALAAAQIQKINAEVAKQQEVNFNTFVDDLKKETIAELSKEGKDAMRELAFAAKSRDRFASPGLIEKLNKSGLANDIDVVKHFISIGKSISEGKFVEGKPQGAGEKDELSILYPSTTKT